MSDWSADQIMGCLKGIGCGLILVAAISPFIHVVSSIVFEQDCSGFIKRAADANSVELAEKEMTKVMAYCVEQGYDKESGRNLGRKPGHTIVLWTTPDEDIEFWYTNLEACHVELQEIIAKGEAATPLEKSNVLMKLRETLLDSGQQGATRVTFPSGLYVYPYNADLAFLFWGPLVVGALGLCAFLVYLWRQ